MSDFLRHSRFAPLLYSHAVTSQSDFWWKSPTTKSPTTTVVTHHRQLRLYAFAWAKAKIP